MEPSQFLEGILKKKWLSANTVRDGIIACFTQTLRKFSAERPLSELALTHTAGEGAVYPKVLGASQDAFRQLKIDDEYPSKGQLIQVKDIMEERLGFSKLKDHNPGLASEHTRLIQSLLDKLD